MTGGRKNDVLSGFTGNDGLIGGFGDDVMNGGDGNDTIVTGYLLSSEGRDTAFGGAGNDLFIADWESKGVFDGGDGVDTLRVRGDFSKVKFDNIEKLLIEVRSLLTLLRLLNFNPLSPIRALNSGPILFGPTTGGVIDFSSLVVGASVNAGAPRVAISR